MKRFKYGLNSQVFQTSNFQELVTLGIHETVPGDTLSGRTSCKLISESASKPIMNRTYMDVFSFYVPFRLVWEDWPDFIAGDESLNIPTVVQTSYKISLSKNTTPAGDNCFARRAYYLIWNKFFRDDSLQEVDIETATGVQRAPLRATTFNQRLKEEIQLQDTTVDTSGATLEVGAIRRAFSEDRFNKTRAYYGSKYTDYLAALGVEASWSILDEPELIGKSSQTLKFVMTDATTEIDSVEPDNTPSYVGSVGGKWMGTNQHSIRRTFAPEHGLIMTVGAVRMDLEYENQVGYLGNRKNAVSQYYSPEFETERKEEWSAYNNVGGTDFVKLYAEKYDDYRVGINIFDKTELRNGTWITAAAQDTLNPGTIRYPEVQNAVNDYLNDQYTGVTLNLNCEHRLQRVSPIRPAQSVHGVS